MSESDTVMTVLNYIAGGIFLLFWPPQIIKTFREKSARDISIISLLLNFTGLVLSMMYSYYYNILSFAIPYSASLLLNGTLMSLKIYYDNFYKPPLALKGEIV